MFRVGEETGTLDQQLDVAAAYYNRELETKLDRATALFEPAIIIFMGVVVGFVAVALISAMYGIYNQVEGRIDESVAAAKNSRPSGRSETRRGTRRVFRRLRHGEEDFTLIELLIVVIVTPIIIGSLAAGLIAMLSCNKESPIDCRTRRTHRIVQASYRNDVQSAQQINLNTASTNGPQCGTGNQILGLESNFNPRRQSPSRPSSHTCSVPVVHGTTTTYSLVRRSLTNDPDVHPDHIDR